MIEKDTRRTPARDVSPALETAEKISRLMDSAIRIPGTNISIGLDPIIGLLPVAGDTISFGISALLILSMAKNGASPGLLIRMFGNVLIDMLLGYVPVVGDLFDFAFKANRKNLSLMQKYLDKHPPDEQQGEKSVWWVLALTLLALAGLLVLMVLSWDRLFQWFFGS
jgi:hypothetical protein